MNFTENTIFTIETRTVAELVRAAQVGDQRHQIDSRFLRTGFMAGLLGVGLGVLLPFFFSALPGQWA